MHFMARAEADATPLGRYPGWFSALLRQRGIGSEEAAERFLSPSPDALPGPALSGTEDAVRLIREAVSRGDPILIWGDYDADGICASSILREALEAEGARVSVHLPSRHTEGYGLNAAGIREAAGEYRLLITVDCGISAAEEVALARSLNMKVIVTDHHTLPDALSPADAVLHPGLGGYACPHLCGAGVALKLSAALRGRAGLEQGLDLAAIATVADVVPLLGENRILVREGLRAVERTGRPGLRALMNSAGITPPLRADHLAFRIGPRLNAAGRLAEAEPAAELLLTRDPVRAEELARHLEALNTRRQAVEREQTAQARAQAEARPDFGSAPVIVEAGPWNPGLVGLTAGRLCERYYRPAVALAVEGDTATGSCRSVPGVNIYDLLAACGDLLTRFGGHAQAAGLTLPAARVEEFRTRLCEAVRNTVPEDAFRRRLTYDLEVPFRTWTEETLELLSRLEPTGEGNPSPVFLLSDASVQSMRRVGRDLSHLQLSLLDRDNRMIRGIAFSMGDEADKPWNDADLLYRPVLNEFRGRRSVEAQVLAMAPPAGR